MRRDELRRRAADIVSHMNLDEKVAQLGGVWAKHVLAVRPPPPSRSQPLVDGDSRRVDSDNRNTNNINNSLNNSSIITNQQNPGQKEIAFELDLGGACAHLLHGAGHVSRLASSVASSPATVAQLSNCVQEFLVSETRLGIPGVMHEESCAGVMARDATVFPMPIGLASSWRPSTVRSIADLIRTHMRRTGCHQALAPVLDVARDGRWGRIEETFGEDPYLIARMGVAYIRGLQEPLDQPSAGLSVEGVAATAKHFIGYGLSEGGKNWAPATLAGEREMLEVVAWPFRAAVNEARVAAVMNGYHEVDGQVCGGSKRIMRDMLRDEIGFDGVVVSDYYTLNALRSHHWVANTRSEAITLGLERAGIDIELPARNYYGAELKRMIENSELDVKWVDEAVLRVIELKLKLGLFDVPLANFDASVMDRALRLGKKLALTAARESIVLLQNNQSFLPLSQHLTGRGSPKLIALIGPHAADGRLMQGGYHYPTHMDAFVDGGELGDPVTTENENAGEISGSIVHRSVHMVTLREAMEKRCKRDGERLGYRVEFEQGCSALGNDCHCIKETAALRDRAVALASRSDIVIVALGTKSGLTKGCNTGESNDRSNISLTEEHRVLLVELCRLNKPVVLVLINGGIIALGSIVELPNLHSIVEAWLPGQAGGKAISQILFGDHSPGGKLPVSLPRSVGQLPVYYNHKPSGGRTHWKGDYVDSSCKPLFCFGHGLSYTRFDYSDLRIVPNTIELAGSRADAKIAISLTVRNVGKYTGDEVVQLYINYRTLGITRPVQELKGFHRVTLKSSNSTATSGGAAECVRLTFQLPVEMVAFYDEEMKFGLKPGTVEVMLGSSCQDIRLRDRITVTGPRTGVCFERPTIFATEVNLEDVTVTTRANL